MPSRPTTLRAVSVPVLSLLLLLGACSGDDDDSSSQAPSDQQSSDSTVDDDSNADGSDVRPSIPTGEETGRPFDIGRDDLAIALAKATKAADHDVDGDTIRMRYDEGSVEAPGAMINCSVANEMKADDDKVELVYPDGTLDCADWERN